MVLDTNRSYSLTIQFCAHVDSIFSHNPIRTFGSTNARHGENRTAIQQFTKSGIPRLANVLQPRRLAKLPRSRQQQSFRTFVVTTTNIALNDTSIFSIALNKLEIVPSTLADQVVTWLPVSIKALGSGYQWPSTIQGCHLVSSHSNDHVHDTDCSFPSFSNWIDSSAGHFGYQGVCGNVHTFSRTFVVHFSQLHGHC